jgi:urease accessory protein
MGWGVRWAIPMTTETGLLSLVQWLSPAFPLGSFAYSNGMETAIASGAVHDAASLERWLVDIVSYGAGRSDAILLLEAMRGTPAIEQTAAALAPSRERWLETLAQGTAFVTTVNALSDSDWPPCALPVAVGRAATTLAVAPTQVVALYLHAFVSNLVSVAVRFVPLGQTDGQRVLAALHPVIETLSALVQTATLDDIASATFGADMAAFEHETLDVRLYKT